MGLLVPWVAVGWAAEPELAAGALHAVRHPASSLAGPPGRCLAHFHVDAGGRVTETEVRGCPEALARSVREVVGRWRFEPVMDAEGRATGAWSAMIVEKTVAGTPPFRAPTCTWDLTLEADGALVPTTTFPDAPCAAWIAERASVERPAPPGTCVARFTSRDEPTFEGCAPEHEALVVDALSRSAFPEGEPQVVSLTVPGEPAAPQLFTLEQLRDGFVLGTRLRLLKEAPGHPPVEERWVVTGHTAAGCTIAATTHDPATGALLEDQGAGTATWEELHAHGRFPAARTEVADDTVTVPAGTFRTRRYTVREEDGSVRTMHFAAELPGPPVSMVVEKDGVVIERMILLARSTEAPAAPPPDPER